MKRMLIGVLTALTLGACASPPQPPVFKYQNNVVTLPKMFIAHCKASPPPAKAAYVAATHEEREKMLSDALALNYVNIKNCNDRLDEADTWQTKALAQFSDDKSAVFFGLTPNAASAATPTK
jgi:hypothetical protein